LRKKSSVWHPNTQMKEWQSFDEIIRAKGVWLIDSNGNKMLDAVASMWCNVWGHSKQELVRAIASQSKTPCAFQEKYLQVFLQVSLQVHL